MPHRGLQTLADLRDAGEFVLAVTADETEVSYRQNRLLRQAVERSFSVIGMAMRRLRDNDPALLGTLSGVQQLTGLRDLLLSSYDRVNDETVWMTIQQYLPTLLAEIEIASAQLRSASPDQR